MALVDEPAGEGHFANSKPALAEQRLCLADALVHKPLVRRNTHRPAKGAGEVADREAAGLGDVGNGDVAAQIGQHSITSKVKLAIESPSSANSDFGFYLLVRPRQGRAGQRP
ncbi:hypothetical protein RFM67_30565 [Mesorhizobium sp. VK2D]|nr:MULTISPECIES: hypothetical protein [unclassified Mesorhizobium]MDX8463175.1 hypothetical protein [Mesorhizobium sp. VK2D]